MKILVCFKAVPELENMAESDWQTGDRFQPETRFVKTVINPLDESALELCLKLRDQGEKQGQNIRLTAVTIGDEKADAIIKTLYALKFVRAARIESARDLRFNPEAVAAGLLEFISSAAPFDLIVMGGRGADGDNAKTPLLLAELLGWPCVTQVIAFTLDGGNMKVTNLCDDGELVSLVRPPLVLAIGNAPATCLRVPTLRDRMSYGKKETEIVTENGQMVEAACEIRSLIYEKRGRDTVIIEGPTPAAKAAALYHGYLKGRL